MFHDRQQDRHSTLPGALLSHFLSVRVNENSPIRRICALSLCDTLPEIDKPSRKLLVAPCRVSHQGEQVKTHNAFKSSVVGCNDWEIGSVAQHQVRWMLQFVSSLDGRTSHDPSTNKAEKTP